MRTLLPGSDAGVGNDAMLDVTHTSNTGQLMVILADTFFQTDINLVCGHDKKATIKFLTDYIAWRCESPGKCT